MPSVKRTGRMIIDKVTVEFTDFDLYGFACDAAKVTKSTVDSYAVDIDDERQQVTVSLKIRAEEETPR